MKLEGFGTSPTSLSIKLLNNGDHPPVATGVMFAVDIKAAALIVNSVERCLSLSLNLSTLSAKNLDITPSIPFDPLFSFIFVISPFNSSIASKAFTISFPFTAPNSFTSFSTSVFTVVKSSVLTAFSNFLSNSVAT